MRVLSIDLDYCMDSCLDMIDNPRLNPWMDDNPVVRWKVLEEYTPIPDKSIFIDDDKVDYCFDVYTKALKYCGNVMFAYDHDAILYRLEMDPRGRWKNTGNRVHYLLVTVPSGVLD